MISNSIGEMIEMIEIDLVLLWNFEQIVVLVGKFDVLIVEAMVDASKTSLVWFLYLDPLVRIHRQLLFLCLQGFILSTQFVLLDLPLLLYDTRSYFLDGIAVTQLEFTSQCFKGLDQSIFSESLFIVFAILHISEFVEPIVESLNQLGGIMMLLLDRYELGADWVVETIEVLVMLVELIDL